MDVVTLLAEAQARFDYNASKHYLKEKYTAKLIVSEQGGLWKADKETISILNAFDYSERIILNDLFDNPVEVDRKQLLTKLLEVYTVNMKNWYDELKRLEGSR